MLLRSALPRHHVAHHLRRAHSACVPSPPLRRRQPAPQPQPTPIDLTHPIGESTSSQSQTSPATPPSRLAPYIFGTLAAALRFYTLQLYLAASQPCHNPHIASLAHQADVASRYDATASDFDSEVRMSELLMGLNGILKKLARKCEGDVLEVSCGTGRNLGYFDIEGEGAGVRSLGFVDLSAEMVGVCRRKWDTLYGSKITQQKLKAGLQVRFMTGSALGEMPLAPSGKKYTTILQTIGLCSTASPHLLLENMIAHLDTTDSGSRILLLEHGRSYLPWLNRILDNAAERHAEVRGFWFNRDIGQLVQGVVARCGMEVVNERRYHFGTT